MKIYVIDGYSKNIGNWSVELFKSKRKAEESFKNYVDEYDATIDDDDEWYATCNDGITWMSLEEREVE